MTYGSIKYAGKYGFGVFEVQSGIALETLLETFNLSSLALQSVLEALNTSPVALQSTLERCQVNSLAFITELQRALQQSVALTSKLQAKKWRREVYHDNHNWIKETLH